MAENPYLEEADPDWCRFLTRVLWILLLVASPVLLVFWLTANVGGLPALLAFVGLFLLVRLVSPANLYAMFRMYSLLSPVRADPGTQVPVRYFRVREDTTDAEVMVRMKGRFTRGNLGPEDLVVLSGRYREGTFHARDGFNQRTGSRIKLAHSHSWVGLLLTVALIGMLVGIFYEPTLRLAETLRSLEICP